MYDVLSIGLCVWGSAGNTQKNPYTDTEKRLAKYSKSKQAKINKVLDKYEDGDINEIDAEAKLESLGCSEVDIIFFMNDSSKAQAHNYGYNYGGYYGF